MSTIVRHFFAGGKLFSRTKLSLPSCQVYRHWNVLQPPCLRQHFNCVSFWSFGGLRALRATLILAPQIHRGSMRLSGGCFSRLLLREACLDLVQGLHTYRRQTPELAVEVPVDVPSRKGALKAGRSATPLANFNHRGTKTRPILRFTGVKVSALHRVAM